MWQGKIRRSGNYNPKCQNLLKKLRSGSVPDALGTINPSPKSLLPQWGKKGKFLLFKMAGHNLSMEHKRVRWVEKMDGGPHACLHKKVFKPSPRSPSQGSMRLKADGEPGLGKRNGSAGKFKSSEGGGGHYAKQGIAQVICTLSLSRQRQRTHTEALIAS